MDWNRIGDMALGFGGGVFACCLFVLWLAVTNYDLPKRDED